MSQYPADVVYPNTDESDWESDDEDCKMHVGEEGDAVQAVVSCSACLCDWCHHWSRYSHSWLWRFKADNEQGYYEYSYCNKCTASRDQTADCIISVKRWPKDDCVIC